MVKKIIAFGLISLLLLRTLPVSAFTEEDELEFGLPETLGIVVSYEDGLLQVSGTALTDTGYDEILLYTADADVYDLLTGCAAEADDISDSQAVRVVYGPELTDDTPPCGSAIAVYLHAGDPDAAAFITMVSDNIQYDEDSCIFLTHDGKYRITISPETMVTDSGGAYASAHDILPGMELFIWTTFMTASFPGQLIPEKVVLVGESDMHSAMDE